MLTSENRRARFLVLSLAVHLALLTVACVPLVRLRVRPRPSQPRFEVKFYPSALLISGGAYAKWEPQPPGRKKKEAIASKRTSNLARDAHAAPPSGAPVSTPHAPTAGDGTDASNANPAYPVFSPRPPVSDRALLPASDQQVVVDVKVSALGEVVETTLVKGLGNDLDAIVLETVKTWRFHPATINGNPVPTIAELVFPFNPGYPLAPS